MQRPQSSSLKGATRIWETAHLVEEEDGKDKWVNGRVCNMIMMIRSTRTMNAASCICMAVGDWGIFDGRHQGVIWCICLMGRFLISR